MGPFPHRRLVPVAVALAVLLVLVTAQRLAILAMTLPGSGLDAASAWGALVDGTRTDLALAALAGAPLVAWTTLAPERTWRWAAHRAALAAGGAVACGALVVVLLLDVAILRATGERFGAGWPALVRGWCAELLERHGPAAFAAAALVALAIGAGVALVVRPATSLGWSVPSRPSERWRDLLLVGAVGTLLVVTAPGPRRSEPAARRLVAASGIAEAGRDVARALEARVRARLAAPRGSRTLPE